MPSISPLRTVRRGGPTPGFRSVTVPTAPEAHRERDDAARSPDVTMTSAEARATTIAESAGLALFALALGIAGTVLDVTVVWFFAAIPLGLAAIGIGGVALHRNGVSRYRSRSI